LYPVSVLMEVRASIRWAREMRGMASIENAVILLSRSVLTMAWLTGAAG